MQNGTNIEVTNKFDDNVIYLRKKKKKKIIFKILQY